MLTGHDDGTRKRSSARSPKRKSRKNSPSRSTRSPRPKSRKNASSHSNSRSTSSPKQNSGKNTQRGRSPSKGKRGRSSSKEEDNRRKPSRQRPKQTKGFISITKDIPVDFMHKGISMRQTVMLVVTGVPSSPPFTNPTEVAETPRGILRDPRNFDESETSDDEEWRPNVQFARGTKKRSDENWSVPSEQQKFKHSVLNRSCCLKSAYLFVIPNRSTHQTLN